ncbi:hypothetical protein [Rhodanobacter sp. PCA2]|uniref:hypothetical protein n=1 Tax=Rhodanobacter sp. PCA2 TaxID=2006117 RepID=UPI0015E7AC78|nr:hypothetical protein [Rhodanobacter sp. PCA2]
MAAAVAAPGDDAGADAAPGAAEDAEETGAAACCGPCEQAVQASIAVHAQTITDNLMASLPSVA